MNLEQAIHMADRFYGTALYLRSHCPDVPENGPLRQRILQIQALVNSAADQVEAAQKLAIQLVKEIP